MDYLDLLNHAFIVQGLSSVEQLTTWSSSYRTFHYFHARLKPPDSSRGAGLCDSVRYC
jgi:hypothetical protein